MKAKTSTAKTSRSGFTLLEVLAALMLFAIAIAGIIQGQTGSVRAIVRSEKLSQALALAQEKMTELEIEMGKTNFEAMKEEEAGDFDSEKLKEFKWTRILEKVELGCFLPDNPDNESNSIEQGVLSIAKQAFEKAIRKVIVRVEWEENNSTKSAQVVQLLVRFEDIPTNF